MKITSVLFSGTYNKASICILLVNCSICLYLLNGIWNAPTFSRYLTIPPASFILQHPCPPADLSSSLLSEGHLIRPVRYLRTFPLSSVVILRPYPLSLLEAAPVFLCFFVVIFKSPSSLNYFYRKPFAFPL
jgi:hypothetical protein